MVGVSAIVELLYFLCSTEQLGLLVSWLDGCELRLTAVRGWCIVAPRFIFFVFYGCS